MSNREEHEGETLPALRGETAGAADTQVPQKLQGAPPSLEGPVSTPIDQRHLGATLTSFADVGSAAVNRISVAAFQDTLETKKLLEQHVRDVQSKYEDCREKFHDEREQRLVIQEQLDGLRATLAPTQGLVIIGSLVAGGGLSLALCDRSVVNFGILLLALGLVVTVFGLWRTRSSRGKAE